MSDTDRRAVSPEADPAGPAYRPLERFWPYAELAEQPTDDELAAMSPELGAALYGTPPQPFSLTFVFRPCEGPDYERALELARRAVEYKEVGTGPARQHRARFRSDAVPIIHDLWMLIGRLDSSEVLLDDQPVPYARELWLPLLWLIIQ